jgi:hypothetical protein
MRCVRSWLQCVSRLRSFHCHQVRSKRERHLPFAARFAGNIGDSVNLIWPTLIIYLATPWVNQLPHPGRSEALRRP